VELTEKQIDFLRGLRDHPASNIPGGYVDDDMDELIDVGFVTVPRSAQRSTITSAYRSAQNVPIKAAYPPAKSSPGETGRLRQSHSNHAGGPYARALRLGWLSAPRGRAAECWPGFVLRPFPCAAEFKARRFQN